MAKIIKGKHKIHGQKVAVIVARFNEFITKNLLEACLSELQQCGVKKNNITVVWVPGAFEIPVTAKKLALKKEIDAVICLGAVIRGETLHYELVANDTSRGIMQVGLETNKPVIMGVLAVDTLEQAYKRSEEKGENKGKEAALAAVEMIDLLSHI